MHTHAHCLHQLTRFALGDYNRWHPNSRQIGIVFNTAQTPGDIYTLDVPSGEGEGEAAVAPAPAVRWTFSEVGGLNTDSFVVPSLIHFETFDDDEAGEEGAKRTIPAFYYKPRQQPAADKKLPVIITIHGGPGSLLSHDTPHHTRPHTRHTTAEGAEH
jgi:dipeptidyl aminopeptidase/acylaminoacyl peptidase